MARVTLDQERCKGCGLCETVCPKHIIACAEGNINSKGFHPAVVSDPDQCVGCAFCATICPDLVITVER
jgi:2-oxoglutarate ferredoxin oxidoreductase subunit delta